MFSGKCDTTNERFVYESLIVWANVRRYSITVLLFLWVWYDATCPWIRSCLSINAFLGIALTRLPIPSTSTQTSTYPCSFWNSLIAVYKSGWCFPTTDCATPLTRYLFLWSYSTQLHIGSTRRVRNVERWLVGSASVCLWRRCLQNSLPSAVIRPGNRHAVRNMLLSRH